MTERRTHYDVVVVGAGPAGSTTALSIRKHAPHLSVCLVDRAVFPRDKSCGDGLGPGAVQVLKELDALEVVADAPQPPAVRVAGPGRWEGYSPGPSVRGRDLSGYVVPRKLLDARLAWLARDRGASLVEGGKFVESTVDTDARTVRLARGRDQLELTCRFLVGADGAYSRVRRDLQCGRPEERYTHVAIRTYASVTVDGLGSGEIPPLRLDFDERLLPAYGWVFPTSAGTANVGVGIPVSLLRRRDRTLPELFDGYLRRLAGKGVAVHQPGRPLSHLLPHAAALPRLAHHRAVVVGDAASMINSASGEGIAYGMAAGNLLGQALAAIPTQPDVDADDAALGRFERQFRDRFGFHLWSCWVVHRFLRSSRWARAVVKAAARDQRVMEDAALMLFDEQGLRVGSGLRIVRSGILGL